MQETLSLRPDGRQGTSIWEESYRDVRVRVSLPLGLSAPQHWPTETRYGE